MPDYKLISADSHVSEPPDLWATRVDEKYRERAPQLMVNPPGKEGAYFYYEGYAPHPIGIGLGAGKSPEELKEFLTKATYADARALPGAARGRLGGVVREFGIPRPRRTGLDRRMAQPADQLGSQPA